MPFLLRWKVQGEITLLDAKILLASKKNNKNVGHCREVLKRIRQALASFTTMEDIVGQSECVYLLARVYARAGMTEKRNEAANAWFSLRKQRISTNSAH